MKRPNQIAFLLLLAIFNACGYEQLEKQAPAINVVKNNQFFCINLPENHVNSESWRLTDGLDPTSIENLGAVWHGNEKGVDFNLKALSSGQYTLCFVKRVFEDSTEARLYIVKIVDK